MFIGRSRHTNMSQQLKVYTYCTMNKQYVGGVQNGKRFTWWEESKIAIWLYYFLAGSETHLSCSEVKEVEIGFLNCHVTTHKVPNGHTHSLWDNCLPTLQSLWTDWLMEGRICLEFLIYIFVTVISMYGAFSLKITIQDNHSFRKC